MIAVTINSFDLGAVLGRVLALAVLHGLPAHALVVLVRDGVEGVLAGGVAAVDGGAGEAADAGLN